MNWEILIIQKIYEIYCKEDVPKVLNRLKVYCDTRQPTGFYEYKPEILFVGVIDGNSFVITPINFRRNATLPKIASSMYAMGEETKVVIRIRPDSYLPYIVLTVASVAANVLQIAEHAFSIMTLGITIIMPFLFFTSLHKQSSLAVDNLKRIMHAN